MILLLLFFSFFNLATTSELCFDSHCTGDYQTIRFPFRIVNGQPKSCGYPGFDLSCHPTGETLLHLPPSGDFIVQNIDYMHQEIRINDPDNCLPKKILSLNLSGSPFVKKNSQSFAFYNCSSSYMPYWYIDPIYCLSSLSYTVYASSSPLLINMFESNCVMIKTVSVPSLSSYSSKLWDDLLLKWKNPDCGRCESIGQRCELKSNSSNGIQCTNSQGRSRVGANVVSIAMGVVAAVICFLGLLCCLCFKINFRRTRSNSSNIAHWIVSSQGLNGLTIDSYPKFVLDESLSLPKPNNNVCPICLAQYRPKEIVKSIPNCQHCFHECCIDEWLRLKASCPVCRKSPLEAPPSNPPA
ncbi:RING-H2 finger protein ATL22-like isoform X1 [Cucumis melo]|uniref:RING-type E3 ubiquitin transferase n=1 Tax=Cucumis melo TaxID=3656 RepID=A0A1S3B3D1_CUCME|nr:RING-H2 finger protein ATL22-like isoform X1 [Cucumis melo]